MRTAQSRIHGWEISWETKTFGEGQFKTSSKIISLYNGSQTIKITECDGVWILETASKEKRLYLDEEKSLDAELKANNAPSIGRIQEFTEDAHLEEEYSKYIKMI